MIQLQISDYVKDLQFLSSSCVASPGFSKQCIHDPVASFNQFSGSLSFIQKMLLRLKSLCAFCRSLFPKTKLMFKKMQVKKSQIRLALPFCAFCNKVAGILLELECIVTIKINKSLHIPDKFFSFDSVVCVLLINIINYRIIFYLLECNLNLISKFSQETLTGQPNLNCPKIKFIYLEILHTRFRLRKCLLLCSKNTYTHNVMSLYQTWQWFLMFISCNITHEDPY